MAGDPSNPFNDKLAQLNGVTFDLGDLAQATPDDVTRSGNNLVASGYSSTINPGTLNVVSYSYVAGFANGSDYTPPVFGIITFDNIEDTFNGGLQQYAIIGFSPDGLILYRILYRDTMQYNTIDNMDTRYNIAMLSEDGFGPGAFTFPVTFGYDPSVYPICFAEGTHILTPSGPRAVEELAAGEVVLTAGGEIRPVRWVGWMTARPARYPRPDEVNPIRVKAHAFAPNVPERDVRLSPGHAVHIEGVLVPVGHLVNGATIVREAVESIRYFHIELETHDVLLAEGLPCESYLDDGNRASFANSGEAVALHGRLDPKSWDDACAPMVAAGPQLVEIQHRLHARAGELGWLRSEEAGLSIVADGVEIAPLHAAANRYWFAIPAAAEVTLRSNCGVLAQLVPGLADHRQLGVAVSQLRIDGEAIALDAEAFGKGFYPTERHEQLGWRWSDGAATLKLEGTAPVMLEIELTMVAPSWISAVPALRIVA